MDLGKRNSTGVVAGTSATVKWTVTNGTCSAFDEVVITNNTLPTADAGADFSLTCNFSTPQLNGSGTGIGTLIYSWTTIDGDIQSGEDSATPTITKAGTYTLTVTIFETGCQATDSVVVGPGDTTDPVVTAPADYSLEGCDTSSITGWVYSETEVDITASYIGIVTANDGGSGIASVTYKDTNSGTCPIVVTRTFTVTDNCGNVGTDTQEIIINDTTPPVLTIPANAAIECTADITPGALGTATATDNCDGSLTPTYTDGDCFGLENEKEINAGNGVYLYFNISGMAGLGVNSIKDFNLTFETNQGKGRAEFILVAPNGKGIVLVGPYCAGGDCDDNDGGTEIYSPTFYPSTSGYNAWINSNFIAEGAGNFTPNGGTTTNTVTGLTNGLVSSFEALTAGMTSLDGQWFVYSKKQENVNGNVRFISSCLTPGLGASCANNDVIIREWTVTDACGNGATGNQVIVISDTTAPVATGSITDTVLEGCSVSDAPAAVTTVAALEALTGNLTISDNCSADANLTVSSSDAVNGTCPIVITRTYKVTDECSNVSVDIIHIIKINDTTKPTATAPANITGLKKISDVPAPDVSLITDEADNCSTATVTFVKDENNGASGCFGEPYIVTRTYKITDDCNNFIEVTQTITVEADAVTVDAPDDVTECDSYTLPALNSGNYFTGTGGTGTALFAGNVITSSQTIYVYAVSADNANCTDENSFLVTINALPVAPSAVDQTECEASPIQTLTATANVPEGFSVVWYDAATGGNVVASPTLNTVGSVTYYAESVNDDTECTSNTRTAVSLEILAAPVAPISGNDQTECEASPIQTLTATANVPEGFSVVWYDEATGGNIVTSPTLNTVGSITYYAESVNDATECTSNSRTAVSLEILAAPVAPISGNDQTECEASPIQTLTATANVPEGFSVVWYDAATGGNVVASPTLNTVGSVTYYAESVNDDTECTSNSRTTVSLTINPTPIVDAGATAELTCTYSTLLLSGVVNSQNQEVSYSYLWTTTNGTIDSGATTLNPAISAPGTYKLTVTDNETGCFASDTVVITQNITSPTVTLLASATELTCNTTSITLSATGIVQGTASYLWSKDNKLLEGATMAILTVTEPGEYLVVITDSDNGCFGAQKVIITQDIDQPQVNISSDKTELTCTTESIILTATATVQGTASYLWSTGATTASISVTTPGSYSVTVTDSDNGCSATSESTIITQDITAPIASVSAETTVLTCATESITLTATATVQGTASYLWSTGATTMSISITTPGSYSVTVTDSENGCSVTSDDVTITQDITAPSASVSAATTVLTCVTESITLTATATVQGTASYLWSTGATTASIALTTPGSYSVTVTDSDNGCSITSESVVITQDITAPNVSISAATTILTCNTQSIALTATAEGAASYLWSTGATTASINVTAAGTYTVTVTGSNGCSATATVTITGNSTQPSVVITGNAVLTCTTQSATLIATATVSGTASYLWNTGATTATISVTAPGEYSVTVTDSSNGCSVTESVTVAQNTTPPVVNISGPTELNCNVTSITLNASGSIVQGTASYLWNTGATTSSIVVNQAGEYTVVVTDSGNGCSSANSITVTENYIAAEINGGSIALCIEDASLNLTTLLPSGYVTGGTWTDDMNSGGLTGNSFDPSEVNLGDYEFTYTEPGDCGRIITVFVNVNDDCVVLACSTEDMEISKVVTPNDDGFNDSFEITGLEGCGFTFGVKIFNRWGKMVYESNNYLNNWKGRHDGSGMQIGSNTELPTGTYYYIVTVSGGSGFKPMTGYIYLGTH